MVLTRTTFSAIALIVLATTTSAAQRGFIPRGSLAGEAGQRGTGPRPVLLGFALECTRCSATGRGGRAGGGGGRGVFGVWHYDEFPRVAAVADGSAAQRAGVRAGDVLLSVDGLSIMTDEGSERFSALRAGDSAHLTLDRAGKTIDVELMLNRGGGRGGPFMEAPVLDEPNFTMRTQGTRVDVWSDTRVVQTTDSTGATILKIGNTVVRVANPSAPSVGRGGGRGRRGGDPPSN